MSHSDLEGESPDLPNLFHESAWKRFTLRLFGKPKDLFDPGIYHRLSLMPILAWIGLGADGLSSSTYGPEEAFRALGGHTYLVIGLALLTAATVFIISAAYGHIIEKFPHGGGGYVVATKTLGHKVGVISGCALLVDYVLTISVSIAASGNSLFSLLPLEWHSFKLPFEVCLVLFLTVLNIRGIKESILFLAPIFLVFLASHIILILCGMGFSISHLGERVMKVQTDFSDGLSTLGVFGMLLLFAHAFSMGGGTYTGIEAVSNGLAIMREPRVTTARKTMFYMAVSLAFTSAGLLFCFFLWDINPASGMTMNASLITQVSSFLPAGGTFLWITILSEGIILIVGAQTGFLDGPRILANLAVDSWLPRRFASLSERLTTMNGILLMGGSAILLLYMTQGVIHHLVVMYSINVFITFSLSTMGMFLYTWNHRARNPGWKRLAILFLIAFLLCSSILLITSIEKFHEGGWITLVITALSVALCMMIHRHYQTVGAKLQSLYSDLENLETLPVKHCGTFDPSLPTAAVLVGGYSGLGIHTVLNILKEFPGFYKNLIFISVGVIDSGDFKGEGAVENLTLRTRLSLDKYIALAERIGLPAKSEFGIGTDAVDEAVKICQKVSEEYKRVTFFAGKLIFQREKWYQRLLHNETAFLIQKRLGEFGKTVVVLPAVVR